MRRHDESKYTLAQLEDMDTLHQGHTDDLKVDEGDKRVWLSRMTVEDGMPYNNQVTVEVLNGGSWIVVHLYQAR